MSGTFIRDETGEDSFTLTASRPWHLDTGEYLLLDKTTTITAFTAAQYSGVNFYALDHDNAQRLLDGLSFQGYPIDVGLDNLTLPAGQWWVGVTYSGSLSGSQTVKGFIEIAYTEHTTGTFIFNVPVAASGNAGAWKSQGFQFSGSPATYIETEGSGGQWMVMSPSQYQSFSSTYANGFHGGSYSFLYALGPNSGGASTEIEGELRLPDGNYYLVWLNDTGSWQGGAANIWGFDDSDETAPPAPTPVPPSAPRAETFFSTAGNDTFIGGAAIDAVVYAGYPASQFAVADNHNGSYTVTDRLGIHGVDYLSGIERLQFSDRTVALDLSGNAGQVYRLYQAAFNRTPDSVGLGGWIYGMDHGMSLLEVSAGFIASAEFKSIYGASPSVSDLVIRFYQNVLHRAPEQAGYDYWVNQLNAGLQTQTQVLTGFSESPENQIQVMGAIQNGIEFTPHV